MSMSKVIKLDVFVIHTKILPLRKSLCEDLKSRLNSSNKYDLRFTYIDKYDSDAIPAQVIKDNVDLTPSKELKRSPFDSLLKGLHVRQLSNALKHAEAIQLASRTEEGTFCLIIEDDAVFGENVAERLESVIRALEKSDDWDVNFLGLPQPISSENANSMPTISNVETLFKILPEISSYIIKKDAALKLGSIYFPVRYMTNIQFSYLFLEKSKRDLLAPLRMTMTTPNVFVDGSKFGVYLSSLLPNNKLILNQDYSKLHMIINSHEGQNAKLYTNEEKTLIANMFETIKFVSHPEFQALKALFETQIGNFEKAKAIYNSCYETYKNNDCLLNGESDFIIQYTRLFKHLQ